MASRTLWQRLCRRTLTGTSASTSASLPEVVIIAAKRTPIGSFQGSLASLSATQLGSIAIRVPSAVFGSSVAINKTDFSPSFQKVIETDTGVIDAVEIPVEHVQEVYMGNVLSAGLGQAPARQAALEGGLLPATICTTVNKICSSGMKAVMLGAQSIMLGINQVVLVGGMESMSNAPYLLQRTLPPKAFGHMQLRDSMIVDGLWDPYNDISMGSCAETCADEMSISREAQDDHAVASYERAAAAQALGIVKAEIAPVTLKARKGQRLTIVTEDEECYKFDPEKLRKLPPVFKKNGTITAGNSPALSDGAAALLLTSAAFAQEHKLPILARIRGFGDAAQSPEKFSTSPALAIPQALKHAGLTKEKVDIFEINEAFSVVDIANRQLLGLASEKVNIHGGSVALGHPIGASGARIIVSLVTALALKNLNIGAAALCNGGGGASAIIIERDPSYRLSMHTRGHDKVSSEPES